MSIRFNVTLVTCDHPGCPAQTVLQGPRLGGVLVACSLTRQGWGEGPADGSGPRYYCKEHAGRQTRTNAPPAGAALAAA